MKRFFQVLLGIGVIITAFSAYLLTTNEIYAIFAAVFGVMIVTFSVFEIISLKKIESRGKNKAATPIASKSKVKEDELEWTYYDRKPKTKKTPIQEDSVKEEVKLTPHTPLDYILSLFRPKKHPKIDGSEVVIDNKKETTKLTENEKLDKLKVYITEAIKNKVPKEEIIKSCVDSGWPEEKIKNVMKSFSKPKRKSDSLSLYIMMGVTLVLFFGLLLTKNLLLTDWIFLLNLSFNKEIELGSKISLVLIAISLTSPCLI